MPTVLETIKQVEKTIRNYAKEESLSQAKLLTGAALDVRLSRLPAIYELPFPEEKSAALDKMAKSRSEGVPLQYILGCWEFMGLPFFVRQGVLIPRQDTESIIEYAIALCEKNGCRTALDLCCGSGCIGVSLAKLAGVEVTMSDVSAECAALAGENARLNGVEAEILTGDLFAPLARKKFDLIAVNPPYLTKEDMLGLQKELEYEPPLALYGGDDGLLFYRRIAMDFRNYLNEGGALIMEIGQGAAEKVKGIFSGGKIIYDINNLERGVALEDICLKS